MAAAVSVLYFAGIKDLLGMTREDLEVTAPAPTLADLSRELVRAHPELEGRLDTVRFAINEEFAEPGHPLAPGDVVAVIPPVAGG